jgi:transposase InsO family protein
MLPMTLQFLIVMIASAINDRLQRKLDYLEEERRILRERLDAVTGGSKKLSFTADQRRRLAVAGKLLTPDERRKCCQLVKPATILAWFRQLAARKYDSSDARRGRPGKPKDVRKLVIRLATENPRWGYTKIRDALRTGLGIEIGRATVANILAEAGMEPAPEREKKRTWKQFMKAHWDSLCGCDFFTVEALGLTGTVRYMVFFVIVVKTRAVEIAGIATNPDGEWMRQMARNLTDAADGFLRSATYLIHDRDPLFTEAFEAILRERGVKCVRIPAQSPNCNPHAERFVETIKYECLNHLVLFGERHLRHVIKEFMAHYHRERFHQGLGGQLIEVKARATSTKRAQGEVVCRDRLGGMLNYYHREAA